MTAAAEMGGGLGERRRWLGASCFALALHIGAAWSLLGLVREAPPVPFPAPVIMVMLDGLAPSQPAAARAASPPPPAEERPIKPETPEPIADALIDLNLPDTPLAEEVVVHIPPRPISKPRRPAVQSKRVPPKPAMQPQETAPMPPVPETAAQPTATETAPPSAAPAASGPPAAASAQGAIAGPPSKAEMDWRARLLGHLERHKRYPAEARAYRQEGVVYVQFLMDRNGRVREARIDRSSGYQLLDAEALAMLKRATPLPAPPAEMENPEIRLAFPLRFSLR